MENEIELPNISEYVSIKEAAKLLSLAERTVYEYVTEGRIPGVWAADVIMIPTKEVENFKRGVSGRPRKNTPLWRISSGDNIQYMALILVALRAGQDAAFMLKLEEVRKSGEFLFPGSVARYITGDDATPGQIQIILVWRGVVMPAETERQAAIEALKQELADVLDWKTAQYRYGKVFMHT